MKLIKLAGQIVLCMLILVSSCVVARKKKLERSLEHVDVHPEKYCITLKARISDVILLKARIGNTGAPQDFMFDTGSPLAYSLRARDSFHIASKKLFGSGKHKFYYGTGSIDLNNVSFDHAGFVATNYVLGYYTEVQGLIGASILQTSICELNFADSTIKISNDLKNFTHLEHAYVSAFEPSEGQATPVIKLAIGKDTLTAFLDTGFSGFIKLGQKAKVPPEAAEKQEAYWNTNYFKGPGKGSTMHRTYHRVHHMQVLGLPVDSIVLHQDHSYGGRNLVGLEFLKKFIVTIDWIHHRIYLKPIEDKKFKQDIYSYGFTCWMHEKQLRVLQVYKNSGYDKAGLKSGDRIVSVNNTTDITDAMVAEINSNKPGNDSIRIEVQGKKVLTLKKYKLFK